MKEEPMWSFGIYPNEPLSISQILEWESSKLGLIKSELHNRIPYLHSRWMKRILKQYEYYRTFNDQIQALSQAKELINQ